MYSEDTYVMVQLFTFLKSINPKKKTTWSETREDRLRYDDTAIRITAIFDTIVIYYFMQNADLVKDFFQ